MTTLALAPPRTIRETGIRKVILEELVLRLLFLNGEMSLVEIATQTGLTHDVILEVFEFLRKEVLVEVVGTQGISYIITPTTKGKDRGRDLIHLNPYASVAPVPLMDYTMHVRTQSIRQANISEQLVAGSLARLVINRDIVGRLGTAVTSGESLFLYGPPGTGKTTITEALPAIYQDTVWIPYSIEIDGHIISVFDAELHRPVPIHAEEEFDRRWVLCQRPRVVAGGELTLEMLDLQSDVNTRFHVGPPQLKANNGILVVDDFGRQRIRPEELLNRWMTPLDRHIDFLTLPTGRKFEIPFDVFVIFSTNIEPNDLVDEAFLRRIPNKIKLGNATPDQFRSIFTAASHDLLFDNVDGSVEYLMDLIQNKMKQPLRPCFARDILREIMWAAAYRKQSPRLDRQSLDEACWNYFLSGQKN